METTAYIGLGANLGNRQASLEEAIVRIDARIGPITARSRWYETAPWGFVSEHPFLNGVISCSTQLAPEALLAALQVIEQELGRVRPSGRKGYADRSVDLDLLFYGEMIRNSSALTLPHPLLTERAFVLEPLNEIAPDLIHPLQHKSVRQLLAELQSRERSWSKPL